MATRAAAHRLLLAALVLVAASVGCDKTESCRPGTLFVNVELGAFAQANLLDVDVTVAGTTSHGQLTLKGGAAGGVEIDFPHGYPAGQSATVVLTLDSGTTQLAQRTQTVPLVAGCTSITVDFAPDGGAGGSSGTAGRGGAGGAGGATGNAGAGGGAAGATGNAGAGGGVAGAGGGVAGAGGGGRGAGGTVGTGGAAGGGGRGAGGTVGTGGAAGGGGHAGSGGAGGGCVRTGPENCFNNIDDDCDGYVDCADTDCSPSVAQCVPLDPTQGKIGETEGSGSSCPTAFPQSTPLMAGFNPGVCAGCNCQPGPTTCTTTVYGFKDQTICASGQTGTSVGTWKPGAEGTMCSQTPDWTQVGLNGATFGIAIDAFTPVESCSASGTAVARSSSWTATIDFCGTSQIGGGCGAGRACVPAAPAGSICQMVSGAVTSCPKGTSGAPWYTGLSGTLTCGACTCTPTGDCSGMALGYGKNGSCGDIGIISSKGSVCFDPSQELVSPSVEILGTASARCLPSAPATSMETPTGLTTLCCVTGN
jgi:hypothetical protein